MEPIIDPQLDLVVERLIQAPAERIWLARSDPELLKRWWAPAPWQTSACTLDLRPGGRFDTVMQGPDGTSFPAGGLFLDVVPLRRIVFTDTLREGYRPAPEPFMTVIISLTPTDSGATHYHAHVLHKDAEARIKHQEMGFEQGWGQCLDQLAALAETL